MKVRWGELGSWSLPTNMRIRADSDVEQEPVGPVPHQKYLSRVFITHKAKSELSRAAPFPVSH